MIIAKSHMKRIVKEEISKILEIGFWVPRAEWWNYDPEFIEGAKYDETSLNRDAWDEKMWVEEFISDRNPHHNLPNALEILKNVLERGREGKLEVEAKVASDQVEAAYNELTQKLKPEYVKKHGFAPVPEDDEDEDEDEDYWDDDEDEY